MRTRRLADGLEVSAIGLGCMGLSEWYGTPDRDEAEATVELALASGVTLFDTADSYAMGRNEEAVGRMLRGRRDALAISTKFGIVRDEQGALAGIDGRPEYVRSCCDASLRRLGVEVIDVYICHRVDPAVPVEETVGAMAELQAAGKVRHLGVSEATPDEIRRAHATAPLAVVQSEYSLASRDVEAEVLPLCESLGIALMAFSPLGRGLLTAAPPNADALEEGDLRRSVDRFSGSHHETNLALMRRAGEVAARVGASLPALALAWLLERSGSVIPIPGSKTRRHLEDNLRALDVSLDAAAMEALDAMFAPGAVSGARRPGVASAINRSG